MSFFHTALAIVVSTFLFSGAASIILSNYFPPPGDSQLPEQEEPNVGETRVV